MKICTKCGHQNNDNQNYCSTCGEALTNAYVVDKAQPVGIVALICGIASLFVGMFFGGVYMAIAGVVCGVISIGKGGKTKEFGIAGLVLGCIALAFFWYHSLAIASIIY